MLVFYISGHGFGHASRDIEVINTLAERWPDLPIQVRTSVPRWLFELTAPASIDFHAVECDTGLVQRDSLHLDAARSIRRAAEFHSTLDARAEAEARALDVCAVRLVVGDVPPLAFAAAARAGVPAMALSNFTWDWIYEDYDEAATEPALVPAIRAAYAAAGGAWRLPMWGGFEAFANILDVPLIARRSRRDPADTRRRFGLPSDRPVVLSSFGGFGVPNLPLDRLDCVDRCTIVVTDATVGKRAASAAGARGIVHLSDDEIYAAGYRYEDLVAASDVVVTKPGFGIVAECAAHRTAIVYTSRGRFREYDVLVREMPRYVRSEFLPQEDLLAGRWGASIDRALARPEPPVARTDGAEIVSELILRRLQLRV